MASDVHVERTGWRDLFIALLHYIMGFRSPLFEVDHLLIEYDSNVVRGLIVYRPYKCGAVHTDVVRMLEYMSKVAKVPAFVVYTVEDFREFHVIEVSNIDWYKKGKVKLEKNTDNILSERNFVKFLYDIRVDNFDVRLLDGILKNIDMEYREKRKKEGLVPEITTRHELYGKNCPAVDVDYVLLRFDDNGIPIIRAFIDFKCSSRAMGDSNRLAFCSLADRLDIPAFVVRYAWDFSSWKFELLNYEVSEIGHCMHNKGSDEFVKKEIKEIIKSSQYIDRDTYIYCLRALRDGEKLIKIKIYYPPKVPSFQPPAEWLKRQKRQM